MKRGGWIAGLFALGLCGCAHRAELSDAVLPLTPTPDAPFRRVPPAVPAPEALRAPIPAVATLTSGLRVVVVERPELPTVSLFYVNRAAYDRDPARLGLAALTARLLNAGTRLSNGDVMARLRIAGREPLVDTSTDGTTIAVTTLSSGLAQGVGLLALVVKSPVFDPNALEAERDATTTRLFDRSLRLRSQLQSLALAELYGPEHPLARSVLGSADAVGSFSISEVRAFHAAHYRPENSTLIVVGAARLEGVVGIGEHEFGGWRAEPTGSIAAVVDAALPAPPPTRSGRIHAIDSGDRQAAFVFGFPCVVASDPAGPTLDVLAMLLGSLPLSRVQMALRHREGLSYGASAGCVQSRRHGMLWVELATDSNRAGEALQLVRRELARLRSETVGAAELEAAKHRLLGMYAADFGSNEAIGSSLASLVLAGEPLERLQDLDRSIRAVSAEAVRDAAVRYLDEGRLSVAVAGARSVLQPQLHGFRGVKWWSLEQVQK